MLISDHFCCFLFVALAAAFTNHNNNHVVSAFSTKTRWIAVSLKTKRTITQRSDLILHSKIKLDELDNDDNDIMKDNVVLSRRNLLSKSIVLGGGIVGLDVLFNSQEASASGGATAGKYTTIPIAKRRYYGRVQQGVHEFLEMGPDVVKGDMTLEKVQNFFNLEGAVIVAAKRKDVNGQCTKKDGDCRGKEIRDSRFNDMKTSMYLLGNAFRTDQQKPPDKLPTVRAARAFFKTMDEMEKRVRVKKPKTNDPEAQQLYALAYDILDKYLDLVELPPLGSGHYDQEFDTLVGETARIT